MSGTGNTYRMACRMREITTPYVDDIEILMIYFIDWITALILSYWVFWYLVKIPPLNTVFTYTTLTRYYRRYHQPEVQLKDMAPNKTVANKSLDSHLS